MKTPRSVSLAILLTTVGWCDPCPGKCDGEPCPDEWEWLGEDEAHAVLSGLIEMANEAERGTRTHACPFGGEATATVAITSVQLGDSGLYRYGKWGIETFGACWLANGYPDLAIDGSVEFASETWVFDSGRRRFKAWVAGEVSWSTPDEAGWCVSALSMAAGRGPGNDEPFTSPLVGQFCDAPAEIPLSSFPSAE